MFDIGFSSASCRVFHWVRTLQKAFNIGFVKLEMCFSFPVFNFSIQLLSFFITD